MRNVTKYIVSGLVVTGLATGGIVLVAFYLFQPGEGEGAEEELFIFDFSITSHQNNSLAQSSTIVLRGTTSGSPDINQIVINGISASSLDPNFEKWGVILNLLHGINQIHIDITYNITSVIENAVEFRINADTGSFPKDLDRTDSSYQDTNNDGLDGMCDNAIFVSKSGNDLNPGDITQPMLTINAGVAKANESGAKDVYISEGSYNESIVMIDGVSLCGGYKESDLWSRDTSNHPIINATEEVNNRIVGVTAHNIQSQTYLDTMEIITANSSTGSSCGVWCYNISDDLLNINNCIISSGDGRDGVNGGSGSSGSSGQNGGVGVLFAFGAGGAGTYNGGNGGIGGVWLFVPFAGAPGAGGGGPGGGAGGSGGMWGVIGALGANGAAGANGANGGNGAVGDGYGTVVNNFWYGIDGSNGGNGAHGSGGGGAGGGGSGVVVAMNGGGGGGGGGSGARGTGGTGGTSAGGSIGILLVEANITITHNMIFTGNGGIGGNGGNGGSGGIGGNGGIGGIGTSLGHGGIGGRGGNGGNGGAGGGGAGGLSFGIYCYDSDSTISDNLYTIGTGGLGGSSSGNAGVEGESGDVYL